jgi:hypothetical protein
MTEGPSLQNLLLERDGAIAVVTVNRPKVLNALNLATLEELRRTMDALRGEISRRQVAMEKAWWGYDVIRIVDPDGNELLFPLDETNDRERQP